MQRILTIWFEDPTQKSLSSTTALVDANHIPRWLASAREAGSVRAPFEGGEELIIPWHRVVRIDVRKEEQ